MSLKALIQVWIVLALGGAVSVSVLAWNGSYEKGSAIDVIKTHIPKPTEADDEQPRRQWQFCNRRNYDHFDDGKRDRWLLG